MELLTIRYEDLTAVICPEKGGTLIQLTKDGVDHLYVDWENLRSPERPRCGVPFLFPIFGRLKDKTYTWEGKEYHMDIHGFGHTSCWTLAEQGESQLRLVLESSPETRTQYPFDFRVVLDYRLSGDGLTIGLTFENTGIAPMPYNYGFHPYFLAHDLANVETESTAGVRIDYATGQALPFGHGTVTVAIPEGAPEAGAALAQLHGPTLLRNPKEGRRMTMTQDESFTQLIFWALAGKPFLCVEPINGTPNGFNTGNYMVLNPGEIKTAYLHLFPENG